MGQDGGRGDHKLRYIGLERNRLWWELTAAAYNLLRLVKFPEGVSEGWTISRRPKIRLPEPD